MKTQMKCRRMQYLKSPDSAVFAETKIILNKRNTTLFGNYNLWPVNILYTIQALLCQPRKKYI